MQAAAEKTIDIWMHLYYTTDRYSPLAQSVERRTVNPQVVGSSPTGGAKKKYHPIRVVFLFGYLWRTCAKDLQINNLPLYRLSGRRR